MTLEQTDTGMELNRGHYLCLPVGFVNIVLVLNICLVRSSPHPLPPGGRVVEILPRYPGRKRTPTRRAWFEGGRKKKAVCLWANWETENGRYVKTLIIWHTPPRGVFCGVKVLQYGPDCFRFKFRQEKWLAKEWPDCFGYKFKHENLLRSSCSRVLTGRQNWFRQIALLSCY